MSQLESTLLQLPLEISHEIYSYILPSQVHVCLRGNKLCLSKCLDPTADFRDFYGHNRDYPLSLVCTPRTIRDFVSHVVRVRRIQSTWGPHWMCEEDMKTTNTLDISLFLVCRRVYVLIVYNFVHMC
jgi:hypothetical protein